MPMVIVTLISTAYAIGKAVVFDVSLLFAKSIKTLPILTAVNVSYL